MSPTDAALDRVTRVPGVRGALLVAGSDGLVVAEQLMDGVDGRAAAALTASLVGRLSRAAECAGMQPPAFVHLKGEAGSVLAAPAAADLVLVAVVGPDANVGLARLEMLDAVGRLD
ncbi:MAG TPA: roadblock/LC7 domain-containing protein [Gemmatimonadales bacterium]|jgi:predicted regulator of Ras-like GTPase activity (Roadblock/LC7/MglB family)|nr:roadblock/LC7 domain-containing protein [Gemmatimonadales bacterium]